MTDIARDLPDDEDDEDSALPGTIAAVVLLALAVIVAGAGVYWLSLLHAAGSLKGGW